MSNKHHCFFVFGYSEWVCPTSFPYHKLRKSIEGSLGINFKTSKAHHLSLINLEGIYDYNLRQHWFCFYEPEFIVDACDTILHEYLHSLIDDACNDFIDDERLVLKVCRWVRNEDTKNI